MQELQFDYYRGMEAEQYTFYRIPKVLFTAECFKSLSCEAKVLYGLLLDRMSLSIKNRWFDEEDRVYIIFTVEEIAELMNCGTQKAVRLLKELDADKGIGLIEKKRLGLGKPNVIYVKNFIIRQTEGKEREEKQGGMPINAQNSENHNSRVVKTTIQEFPESQFKNGENHNSGMMKTTIQESPESQFKNGENHTSGMVGITIQEFPKSQSNKTDINKTDLSKPEFSETECSKPDLNDPESGVSAIHPNPILSNQSIPGTAPDVMEEMDEGELASKGHFRVVYYPEITGEETSACEDKLPKERWGMEKWIKGMRFEQTKEVATLSVEGTDLGYEHAMKMLTPKLLLKAGYDLSDCPDTDQFFEDFGNWGCKVGGHPAIRQGDVRQEEEMYQAYTTLLFQMDFTTGEELEADTFVFFIKPEDLAKENFEDVLLYWHNCY